VSEGSPAGPGEAPLWIATVAALAVAALAAGLAGPDPALAHGLGGGRADLPISKTLFIYGAALVLILSFVALAVLWPEPKLEEHSFRPLPRRLSRVVLSRPVGIACGAVGVLLLGVTVWSGLQGVQSSAANFAPTFVYVLFYLGLVPVSMLLGDVFRAFNPWRAIGKTVAWVAQTAARGPIPPPLSYPERLGRWPAAAGLFAFVVLELVISDGDQPDTLAAATLAYSALTFVGMTLYGVEAWCERGEAFGVYFNLFSRISPLERRGDRLGLRPPLSGLAEVRPLPGTVALLAVMIGSVSFDGWSEGSQWTSLAPDVSSFFESLGLSPERALEAAFLVGLAAVVLLVFALYRLGIAGARSVGGGLSAERLKGAFAHTLVPIALAYVAAHYLSELVFQGQAIVFLASNPLGEQGTDLFGTADRGIDYGVMGATFTQYAQVFFVLVGHVAALALAHDRALVVYDRPRLAVLSQYWMLIVMVGFTTLALVLLLQSNA